MLYAKDFQNALKAGTLPSRTVHQYHRVKAEEYARLGKKKIQRDNRALPQNNLVLRKARDNGSRGGG